MKKLIIFFTLLFFVALLNSQSVFAQDEGKPAYIEKAKSSVEKLLARGAETKDFADDVLAAQNYLKLAETEYTKSLGWTGKVKEGAEPTIRHYATMAELTATVVFSRLEKINQDKERARLEKLISETKARIKIFDDKNAEIVKLKGDVNNLSKELALLKTDKANLSGHVDASDTKIATLEKDIAEKNKALEELKRVKDELKAIESQKGMEFVEVQARLRAMSKAKEFLIEVSKMGMITKASEEGVTLMLPRTAFIKATPKGPGLSSEADKNISTLSVLMQKFPEYKITLKVFGFGQPAKNENAKATEQMAKVIKDALAGKGKMNAALIEAIGAGPVSPLFPKSAAELNKRVEITFIQTGQVR